MIRCPKCTTLTVRDTRKCSCGYAFTADEPEATPTADDVREWERTSGRSRPLQHPPSGTAVRFVVLIVIVVLAQFLVPLFGLPADLRGGVAASGVVPGLFVVLWVVFSLAVVGTFLVRDGSTISLAACISYGFLLALVSTVLLLPRMLPHGPYGPGP